jgi:hypothetical protein
VEPNDTPAGASLLPKAKPVSGRVGDPTPAGEPDFDYYRLPPSKGRRAVTAVLTGVPDVDLVLELYDEQGQRLAKVDGARKGGTEVLGPVAAPPGDTYVRARPVWSVGEPPAKGSPTPYELTVDWEVPRPDWELEPNDSPEDATLLKEGISSGRLYAAEDEDWFKLKVPPGEHVEGKVEGIEGIDLVVLAGSERKRVDTGGLGNDETFELTPGKDGRAFFAIIEQPPRKGGKAAVPEREEPYILRLKFRPTAH